MRGSEEAALCQQDGLLFRSSCSFPVVWHPPGLSTLPQGSSRMDRGEEHEAGLDDCSQEGGGSFSPWAAEGRAGRRNRLAPYIL